MNLRISLVDVLPEVFAIKFQIKPGFMGRCIIYNPLAIRLPCKKRSQKFDQVHLYVFV